MVAFTPTINHLMGSLVGLVDMAYNIEDDFQAHALMGAAYYVIQAIESTPNFNRQVLGFRSRLRDDMDNAYLYNREVEFGFSHSDLPRIHDGYLYTNDLEYDEIETYPALGWYKKGTYISKTATMYDPALYNRDMGHNSNNFAAIVKAGESFYMISRSHNGKIAWAARIIKAERTDVMNFKGITIEIKPIPSQAWHDEIKGYMEDGLWGTENNWIDYANLPDELFLVNEEV